MACVPCWLSLRSGCRNVMSLKSLLSMGRWSIRYFKGCLVLISSQLRQGSASFSPTSIWEKESLISGLEILYCQQLLSLFVCNGLALEKTMHYQFQ